MFQCLIKICVNPLSKLHQFFNYSETNNKVTTLLIFFNENTIIYNEKYKLIIKNDLLLTCTAINSIHFY